MMQETSIVIDKRAVARWNNANISLKNHQDYIDSKHDRFHLSLIDLLFVSNFKGGNATIGGVSTEINTCLRQYTQQLLKINLIVNNQHLAELKEPDFQTLTKEVMNICDFTESGSKTKIKGLSVSYLSGLLCAYFPNTIPVLDRRILINIGLVGVDDLDNQKQVRNIGNFYEHLMKKMRILSIQYGKNIREIDRKLFIQKL